MKQLKIYLSLIALITISACDREIPFADLPEFEEKLVLNAELNNQQPISIEASSSASAYVNKEAEVLEGVNIVLLKGNQEIPLIYDGFFKRYISTEIPAAGVSYTVRASYPGLISVTSNAQIPSTLQEKNATYIIDGGTDNNGNTSDLLKVSFRDRANENNYYKLNFYYFSVTLGEWLPFDFNTDDPSLNAPETVSTADGGFVVSDQLFNGQLKEFVAVPPAGLVFNNPDEKYLIQLRVLSEDYYRYFVSLAAFKEQIDDPANLFNDGIVVHSNVNGGLGIFAGTWLESDTLR
jgi:hypothetical protein